MKKYEKQGKWSDAELMVKEILESFNVKYYHNYKIHNEQQTGFFSLDFLLPRQEKISVPVVIEVNPKIWHSSMGDADIRDRRKLNHIQSLGWIYILVTSDILNSRSKLIRHLEAIF